MNRGLLVGINAYPTAPLQGCVNDVTDMANFLVNSCGFAMGDIRLLVDDRATTAGIIERLGWLLTGLQKGDRVVFHYSGHGAQMSTRNPQGEVDGLDEVICPVDFDWTDQHAIRDKQFAHIFSAVPDGVEFVWISDSCHSGDLSRDFPTPVVQGTQQKTILPPADLNWRLQTAKSQGIGAMGIRGAAKAANVALVAGCKSDQTSADAVFADRHNGALTHFLLQELAAKTGLAETLTQLVKKVNTALAQAHFTQQPQLEGSKAITTRAFLAAAK